MAFISSAFTAGQTLTAASMEDLRGNANAGHSVFTNEAARDAAITAPTEGLMAYLTAPTVPAATGDTTAVPTGVVTIYNGSAWVCTTVIGARTDATGTTTSATYTATLAGSPGTNPSVTLVTGTTALVMLSTGMFTSGGSGAISVAVSGATTLAANTVYGMQTASANSSDYARTFVLTGLTAGTNTFTLQYNAAGGGTQSFLRRNLTVQGIA